MVDEVAELAFQFQGFGGEGAGGFEGAGVFLAERLKAAVWIRLPWRCREVRQCLADSKRVYERVFRERIPRSSRLTLADL